MIYILCAMPCEAQPIIDKYSLKYEEGFYCGEAIKLIITGMGKINMAYAIGTISSSFAPSDKLINIGVCASNNAGIYEIVKVTDNDTGKELFPDIVYELGLPKANLVTVSKVINDGNIGDDLYDMEGSSFVQCGLKIAGPHQLSLLKIVSDNGHGAEVTNELVKGLINDNMPIIDKLIECSLSVTFASGIEVDVKELSRDLKCSEYMYQELITLIRYAKLADINYDDYLNSMYSDGLLPVSSKKQGKEILDALRQYITI